ncbi:MAG: hypothetical protein KGH69_01940 [Candidatus Micrarchaeota archaeon]|nr:hypothetical protein [Candidatus Micrarchaeota archaeon]
MLNERLITFICIESWGISLIVVLMSYVSNVNGLELYKFSEFQVVVGNPESSVALCVVWQDLGRVLEANPGFKKDFAIIGNLRSPFGANIILYNLALNPQIRYLVVWGPDRLSNTNIGTIGKSALLDLWSKGIDAEMRIKGTPFKIVGEIDTEVLSRITSNVELHELSSSQSIDLSKILDGKRGRYMEPVRFREFTPKTPDVLPSEGYTYVIRARKGADAYLQLLYTAWRYGKRTPINRSGEDVKEIRDSVVVVEDEDPDNVHLPSWLVDYKPLAVSSENLDNYFRSQFSADPYRKEIYEGVYKFDRPKEYPYLYTELINAFPRVHGFDEAVYATLEKEGYGKAKDFIMLHSNVDRKRAEELMDRVDKEDIEDRRKIEILIEGIVPPTDQIGNVIDRIRRKEPDLDKEVVLWDQRYHSMLESSRPCIEKLSFSVRDGRVDMHVFVRTHDIGMAWFHNFYGLVKTLGRVCKETGKRPGFVVIESQSAHIYQRDWEAIGALIKKRIDDAPVKMYFDPEKDSDPRGIVNITTVDGTIKLKLQNAKTGETIVEMDGKTARQLIYKIKHFGIISTIDHATFVGAELAKAEMCIKLGIQYRYDTVIELPNGERLVS